MQHFAGEAATLDLQSAGAKAAIEYGTKKEIFAYAKELALCERNRILKSGEQTFESANNKNTIDMLKTSLEVINIIKKDDGKKESDTS